MLVNAVTAAKLVNMLTEPGPFTVFAPNDDAFAKIPADVLQDLLKPENIDKLKKVLKRHVLTPSLMSQAIQKGETKLLTVGAEQITITNGEAVTIESAVGNATVIKFDLVASNGVIHIVDSVF